MKKEPCLACLEHGDKTVVKGQCPNYKRPYGLYCVPAEMKKGQRETWMDSSSQMRKSKQNEMDPKKQW